MKRIKRNPYKGMSKPIADLYRAVDKYVRANGGSIAVIGGVQVIEFDANKPYNFTVGVCCTGRKPTFIKEKS